ncbi:hypothetical protein BGW41_007692 [Actinomortierella wolfii]|nr:hypothetical protein BGW41_007692 [Actinomortierella wolfii]
MEKEHRPPSDSNQDPGHPQQPVATNNMLQPPAGQYSQGPTPLPSLINSVPAPTTTSAGYGYPVDQKSTFPPPLTDHKDSGVISGMSNPGNSSTAYGYPTTYNGAANFPGVSGATPVPYQDPNVPRPNDILPLHPAIIQQRQIAASLPPCPKGGYHELRTHHALGMNLGTVMSVICFPIVCCCVRDETVCIKCHEKFNFALPPVR